MEEQVTQENRVLCAALGTGKAWEKWNPASCLTFHFQPVANPRCLIWKVVCCEVLVTHG